MLERNSKLAIVSISVVAAVIASLLHEGLGHGVTAWLRGDIVTELTSNHLNAVRGDRLVDAGGTVVNLIAGALTLTASYAAGARPNLRYFFWVLAALNLLMGAGYFLFSGVLGVGDWGQFIHGMTHQAILRTGMAILGAALYILFVRMLAVALHPFVPERRAYNTVGRLPYYAACLFMCAAGALDPLGIRLLLISTVPAFFGGLSGLMWADWWLPRARPQLVLVVTRSTAWLIAAILIGGAFLLTVARGIEFDR